MQYGVPFRSPTVHPSGIDLSGHCPGSRLWVLVGAIGAAIVYPISIFLLIGAVAAADEDVSPVLAILAYLLMMVGAVFYYVRLGCGMYWLYGAWKWLPMEQRFDRVGRPRTPSETFMLFIPYFNFYWMFVYNYALCDALDRMRVRYRTTEAAPRDLATWASISEIVPLANLVVAPFLWASYMKRIDRMHEEMIRQA